MSFPTYPSYTDSGVAWLGLCPSHWDVQRLKHLGRVDSSGVDKKSNDGDPTVRFLGTDSVYGRERVDDSLDLELCTATLNEVEKLTLQCGDIILTKDSVVPTRIADTAIVAQPLSNVVCGYHLILVRPNKGAVAPKFLFYHLSSLSVNQHFLSMARGTTIIGISSDLVGGTYLCHPPLEEQALIAEFLDHETARIDALIEEQQRLIELLHEKRQAVISHAVTRGIDPDVPMKDSGIDWLGDVPVHWSISPIKRFIRDIEYGTSEPSDPDGTVPLISMTDVQDGEIRLPENRHSKVIPDGLNLEEGDLLFNRTNSRELVGKVGIYNGDAEATFASYLVRFRVADGVDPYFTNFLMNSKCLLEVARSAALPSIGQANLNPNRYAEISVCMPPYEEQIRIRQCLENQSQLTKELLREAGTAVTLLKERRSALISAAVTGKIDVREWEHSPRSADAASPQAAGEEGRYG